MNCTGLQLTRVDPPDSSYQRRGSIQNSLLGNLYVEPSITVVDEVVHDEFDPENEELDEMSADSGMYPVAELDPDAYPSLLELLEENRLLREAFTGLNIQCASINYLG